MPGPRRYLVQFQPKRTPHVFTDILVIGAGIAGLRAALEIPAVLDVLVVTKDRLQQSNSTYAQGGIAGVHVAGGPLREPHRGHARRPAAACAIATSSRWWSARPRTRSTT